MTLISIHQYPLVFILSLPFIGKYFDKTDKTKGDNDHDKQMDPLQGEKHYESDNENKDMLGKPTGEKSEHQEKADITMKITVDEDNSERQNVNNGNNHPEVKVDNTAM